SNIPGVPGNVYASNDCDPNIEVVFSETTNGTGVGTGCDYTIVRTWTATDPCGVTDTKTQTITVVDTTAPVPSAYPQDMNVECDNMVPVIPEITWTDECGEVESWMTEEIVITDECEYEIIRIWHANDGCNFTNIEQHIYVNDNTAPVFNGVPSDMVINCGEPILEALVTANDDCDDAVEITLSATTTDIGCESLFVRTWTAVDNCGNTAVAVQTIVIEDHDAPEVMYVPENMVLECSEVISGGTALFSDLCDADLDITFSEVNIPGEPVMDGAPPCGYTLIRTWTATDDCGNATTVSQTIEVVDTTAPEIFGVPDNISVDCSEIPEPAVVTATDNCWEGEINLFMEESVVVLDDCTYQIVRTWVAEDNCWNYNSDSQVITVVDTEAPVLIGVPADATYQCDNIPAAPEVMASDLCLGIFPATLSEQWVPQECGFIVYRTWTATDPCGYSVSATQTIIAQDTTAPVLFNVPENTTMDCSEEVEPAFPFATDNCDDDVLISLEATTEPADCGYLFIRTWTATDDCNNSTTATQIITVTDNTAPVAVFVPAGFEIECSDEIPSVWPQFIDLCDADLDITFSEVNIPGEPVMDGAPPCGYTLVRTWTATDDCGNAATVSQTIE
ncbi:MAG: hypothetical protein JNM00_05795, partial [Flavobacteriales bacterium]|nr:hypothetical protein [Flavobacteriales bacterium]